MLYLNTVYICFGCHCQHCISCVETVATTVLVEAGHEAWSGVATWSGVEAWSGVGVDNKVMIKEY